MVLFGSCCVLDRDTHGLHPTIIEYIEGVRVCLETEVDRESFRDIKLHFCNFIKKMIKSFSRKSANILFHFRFFDEISYKLM